MQTPAPAPCLLAALLLAAPAARAQDVPINPHLAPPVTSTIPPPPLPAAPTATPAPIALSRRDIALAYIDFERAFVRARPQGDELLAANRSMEDAVSAFFSGNSTGAVRQLVNGAAAIRHQPDTAATRIARSLLVRVEPEVWKFYSEPAPVVHIRSMWPAPLEKGEPWPQITLLLEPQRAGVGGGAALLIPPPTNGDGKVEADLDLSSFFAGLIPGIYTVQLMADGVRRDVGAWYVVSAPRDDVRAMVEREVEQAKPPSPDLRQALAIFRARLALMKDHPSLTLSSEFLTDQVAIESDLIREKAALLAGTNPYSRLVGESYRVFTPAGAGEANAIPLRVYAPEKAKGAEPLPLVIALHGAGADEAAFMRGYAGGRIKQLADEKNFIVASPLAYAFTANPALLDDLIASLASDYSIDRSRIYLIGHSMGAIAASALAQVRSDTVAAAACIAGARAFSPDQPCAPTIVFVCGLDRVFNSGTLSDSVQQAIKAGKPVELREVKDCGHGLAVAQTLDEAIAWLLTHTKSKPAP